MRKVFSLILAFALICASTALVFADGSADNSFEAETRGSKTRYFTDDIGNKYKAVGTTSAAGSYGSAWTTGSIYRPLDNNYLNFYGVTVTVTANTAVTFTDYSTDTSTLSGSVPFYYPYLSAVAGNSFSFSNKLIYNLTCSHSVYTDHGGSVSFITLVLTQ